ncbi:hypothetical protein B9Z55_016849 [Caenorhabditis nigoni]|nr:hypothetical protein B9Z55_016849 [Caenorhabditis nigoni]
MIPTNDIRCLVAWAFCTLLLVAVFHVLQINEGQLRSSESPMTKNTKKCEKELRRFLHGITSPLLPMGQDLKLLHERCYILDKCFQEEHLRNLDSVQQEITKCCVVLKQAAQWVTGSYNHSKEWEQILEMMVLRVIKTALLISFMAHHSPAPAIEPNCEPFLFKFLDAMQTLKELDSLEKVEFLQKKCHEMNGCYEELLGDLIDCCGALDQLVDVIQQQARKERNARNFEGTMTRHTHKPILISLGILGVVLLGIYFYVHFHSIQEDQNEFAAQEQILNQALPDDKQSSTCRLMLNLFIVRMKQIQADNHTEVLSAQEHCNGLKKCFTSSGAFRGNGNFDIPDFGVKRMELENCCEVLDAAADWFKNSEEPVQYPGVEKCNTDNFGIQGQSIDLPAIAKEKIEWCAQPELEYVQDYFPNDDENKKHV